MVAGRRWYYGAAGGACGCCRVGRGNPRNGTTDGARAAHCGTVPLFGCDSRGGRCTTAQPERVPVFSRITGAGPTSAGKGFFVRALAAPPWLACGRRAIDCRRGISAVRRNDGPSMVENHGNRHWYRTIATRGSGGISKSRRSFSMVE